MINEIVNELESGKPILLYDFDDRESEVDMVYAAEKITPKSISVLRNNAGGLVCVAIPDRAAEAMGLPLLSDILNHPTVDNDLKYDSRSSFSLWVNHRSNYTVITDIDRSTTAKRLSEVVAKVLNGEGFKFSEEFRSPGHVPVLRAHKDLIDGRRGHTEMSVYLMMQTSLSPTAVICEMMDDDTGGALSLEKAERYAEENDLLIVGGDELMDSKQISDGLKQ